jgi:hypothetical protein
MIIVLIFLFTSSSMIMTGCSSSSKTASSTQAIGNKSRCMTTVPTGHGPLRKVQCWQ